ncbi:MAG: UvrD-helicase domain-containing protein [Alphaproteobacteria bacterium]
MSDPLASLPAKTPESALDAAPGDENAPWLQSLNAEQRDSVLHGDGPLLVLAGAGTGKTRVLTTRLAHLLRTGRARPGELLAVTFTNKAAQEMRSRVSQMIGRPVEGWWLGTFHALAARMLRRHAEVVGLRDTFTILDADDQLRLVRQVAEAEGIDAKRWPHRLLLNAIQRWKDRGLRPDQVSDKDGGDIAGGRLAALYRLYQDRLLTQNAADFGDLTLHVLTILSTRPEILADYHRRFRHILVDEYQDTNVAQYLWLRLLARGHNNICCVGDDDQSIYGWRGAEVGNILRFEKDFPGAKIIRLERNYRSTGHILGAASTLIANNAGRLGKTLWTEAEAGDPVTVRGVWDGEEEARAAGEDIEALQRAGVSVSEIAVLVRAGFQTREFEERFMTLGLPYRVIGGPRFYERQEIRDANAYLRVIYQPDDDMAFERIVNRPRRGIGDVSLRMLHTVARAQAVSLTRAAARLAETDELPGPARRGLTAVLGQFDQWRRLAETATPSELVQVVLDESGYTAMLQVDRSPEAPGRLENLKELVHAVEAFESLGGYLEHVSLVMEAAAGDGGDMVSIMTLHGAKGLEFDHVFLAGWEEGLFPHQRAMDESGLAGLEEERRLAYVGLTRARRSATISFAATRRIHNQFVDALPSRFIDELAPEHVVMASDSGLFGHTMPGAAAESAWEDSSRATPGLARLRRNRSQPGLVPAGGSNAAVPRPGVRVFHQKFGYGQVLEAEGDRLEIAFEQAGTKRVMASFIVPADQV